MKQEIKTEVKLIALNNNANPLLTRVITTLNGYLMRNKGAASDFALMKDVVERHCDAADEEISHNLPVPLYLGLMGTVLGIILGLFQLNNDVTSDAFFPSIGGLLSSIKLAMICSFFGLLLTTIMTALWYRKAKARLEVQKNELYTFIQMEIMPTMTDNAVSSFVAMQENLTLFNTSFKQNVQNFDETMTKIENIFDSQLEITKQIKNMDVAKIAHLNVDVLKQLDASMKEFEKFNEYMGLMNSFVTNTAELNDAVTDQLKRTGAIESIVGSLEKNIEDNKFVMTRLENFLAKVEAEEAIKKSTIQLDNTLSEVIDQIRLHVQKQVNELERFTTEATNRLGDLTKIVPERKAESKGSQEVHVTADNKDVVEAIRKLGESFKSQLDSQRKDLETLKSSKTSLVTMVSTVLIAVAVIAFGIIFLSTRQPVAQPATTTSPEGTMADTTAVDTTAASAQYDSTAVIPNL